MQLSILYTQNCPVQGAPTAVQDVQNHANVLDPAHAVGVCDGQTPENLDRRPSSNSNLLPPQEPFQNGNIGAVDDCKKDNNEGHTRGFAQSHHHNSCSERLATGDGSRDRPTSANVEHALFDYSGSVTPINEQDFIQLQDAQFGWSNNWTNTSQDLDMHMANEPIHPSSFVYPFFQQPSSGFRPDMEHVEPQLALKHAPLQNHHNYTPQNHRSEARQLYMGQFFSQAGSSRARGSDLVLQRHHLYADINNPFQDTSAGENANSDDQ